MIGPIYSFAAMERVINALTRAAWYGTPSTSKTRRVQIRPEDDAELQEALAALATDRREAKAKAVSH